MGGVRGGMGGAGSGQSFEEEDRRRKENEKGIFVKIFGFKDLV
jgi:hypothetical protein